METVQKYVESPANQISASGPIASLAAGMVTDGFRWDEGQGRPPWVMAQTHNIFN